MSKEQGDELARRFTEAGQRLVENQNRPEPVPVAQSLEGQPRIDPGR